MKKYFKGFVALSVLTICGSLVGTVFNSCSEQDSDSAENNASDAKTFLNCFQTNIDSIMLADVVSQKPLLWRKGAKMAAHSTQSSYSRPLLLKVPDDVGVDRNSLEKKLSTVQCTMDIVGLVKEFNLEYSVALPKRTIVATELSGNTTTAENTATAGNNTETVGNTVTTGNKTETVENTVATGNNTETVNNTVTTDNADYVIHVSESAVRKSLDPLVQESKRYLYSKGFTEKEIQEMLAECGADESELVRFVLAISAEENAANEMAAHYTRNFNTFSMFATPAYAQNWRKIGGCAMEALGADVIFQLQQNSKALGKAAIKKAFKTVAKRMLGWVGVAIAVVEFGICMTR